MASKILSLKRELFAAGEEITSAAMLASQAFQEYAQTIASAITERFGGLYVRIKNDPADESVAYTDNYSLVVNVGYRTLFEGRAKLEGFKLAVGLILHETLHCLFTDFKTGKKAAETLRKENRLFPDLDSSEISKEAQGAAEWLLKKKAGARLVGFYHNFDNIVEDGFIETMRQASFEGLAFCLDFLREESFKGYKSLEDMITEGYDNIASVLNLALSQAKFGMTKGDIEALADAGNREAQAFLKLRPYIDRAVAEKDATARRKLVNIAFLEMLAAFKELREKPEEPPKSGEGTPKEGSGMKGGVGMPCGSTGKGTDEEIEAGEPAGKPGSKSEEEEEGSESEGSEGKEGAGPKYGKGKGKKGGKKKEKEGEESKGEGSESEKSEKEKTLEDLLSSIEEAVKEHEDHVRRTNTEGPKASAEKAASPEGKSHGEAELEKLADAIEENELKRIVFEGKYRKVLKNTQDCAVAAREEHRLNKKTPVKARLLESCHGRKRYKERHRDIDIAARRATQILQRELTEMELGDTDTGHWQGQIFTSSEAWRRDKKCMSRVDAPEDRPDMEVMVLVDESGSMCNGQRMDAARDCAYFTYQVCKALKVPCSIYGHEVTGDVFIDVAATPDMEADGENPERIFALDHKWDNNDGLALRTCIRLLKKSHAACRYLFVISDGEPYDGRHGYCGVGSDATAREVKEDIRGAVKDAKRAGLNIVTAGIDDCADSIRKLWVEGVPRRNAAEFLAIGDLTKLPRAFADIIIRQMS